MLRPVITATALIALVGSSLAYAQHGFGGGASDDQPRFEHGHRLSASDASAFADARIAALKAHCSSRPTRPRIGRNSSRRCAISFSCASKAAGAPGRRAATAADHAF